MVEYREHLKHRLAVAAAFATAAIATGITAIAQQFSAGQKSMNALVIHEIIVQFPTGFVQTDTAKFHVSTKSETAVKKSADPGVILADDFAAGTVVGANPSQRHEYKLYPNELVSSANIYVAVDSSDTGDFDFDIIYTIRQVPTTMFINALLPGQS